MKVLFAVNNDNISDAVIKQYQKEYKEILSYKNVYYFNAILKELQKDSSYDRVVISEDLEPFANNNYDTIDKFLFEKLDKISDEAIDESGNNTDIILICADRRNKSDDMLVKLFGIGVYSALLGQDRSVDQVCRLIYKPRAKKEAKDYYNIGTQNVSYQAESENSVSEAEVQNILAHYKRLGKNEDKYVDSFNNIVSQYTDIQLKIIIKYLPMNIKAVLEEKSPKYQELVTFDNNKTNFNVNADTRNKKNKPNVMKKQGEEGLKVQMLEQDSDEPRMTKPVVIPSGISNLNVKKVIREEPDQDIEIEEEQFDDFIEVNENNVIDNEIDNIIEEQPRKGRGRPRKAKPVEQIDEQPKKGRGRPRKNPTSEEIIKEEEGEIDLFGLGNDGDEEKEEEIDLFGLGNDGDEEKEEVVDLFGLGNDDEESSKQEGYSESEETNSNYQVAQTKYSGTSNFSNLLTKEKKVVAFVGTTKNGTSFIVNNTAELLSSMGISTAILDMTKSKNAYYIYTKNEENLRKTAADSIYNLKNGVANGIKVNKNLTIYTGMPGEEKDYSDAENILSTLVKNYSLVLIDCDFYTDIGYFENAQEIFLVQTMDVLTIQPLTFFLRDLKAKNVLTQEKVKIVVNKEQKLKSLPIKTLIGGIAFYNDPSMSYMTELFNKDKVPYCTIPFEIQTYARYLEGLINCDIRLNGYSKLFMNALKELGNMVYPLISRQTYSPRGDRYKDDFSNDMNDTLNKMKRNYQ